MAVSLVALRCRTADRFAGAPARGGDPRAARGATRSGVEPRSIGSARRGRARRRYEEDLRDSRGCLLEAGGQVDDALAGGRHAGAARGRLLGVASRRCRPRSATGPMRACSGSTRTATTTRPDTSGSGYLGGMCLARRARRVGRRAGRARARRARGARGRARPRPRRAELLERSAATVIGASTVETLVAVKNALDGAPVFVHLDLDVLDPEHFPAAVPGARRAASGQALRPARRGGRGLRAGRPRGHGVRGARRTRRSATAATETAMHVLEPFLDHLAGRVSEHRARAGRTRSSPARRCARSSRTCTSGASRRGSAAARRRSRASTSRTSSPRASGSRC